MGTFSDFFSTGKSKAGDGDLIRINRRTGHIQSRLQMFQFVDKDTKQHICFIPAFQMSGYGKTKAKAVEMLKLSMDDYFTSLMQMSDKQMKQEMISLGWHIDKFFKKEYSRAFVDQSGELQNFNPEGGKIEKETFEYAA